MALISKEDLLTKFETGALLFQPEVKRIIKIQPEVDAVPVVRCKDCEWWERIYDDGPYGYCHSCKHGFYSANWEISIYRRYKEDFFCADGERRTDDRSD